MESETGFETVGNARIYYELAGQGQPLVLIHAGVADSRQWNNEVLHFAQKFRVLRYDLRGYGKSNPVAGEFSHLGDLLTLLNRWDNDERLVLMGCSMGGTLAMDFALANPSRTKALILVGSGPSGLELDVPEHPKEQDAERAYEAGDLDTLTELETQIWFDGMGRTPRQVDPKARALAFEMNHLALTHDAKQLGKRLPDTDPPAVDRLANLEVPLLTIVGEHDIPYIHAAAEYLQAKVPSARKVVIRDAAHLPNMDQPREFQDAVVEFLNDVL